MSEDKIRPEILTRLRTVKGHIAGIERMVGEEAPCRDILLQLSAVRASIEKIGIFILENNAANCLAKESLPAEERQKFEQIVKDMVTFLK